MNTSIYDEKDNEMSLHGIWTHRPFEEYEIHIGFGNQRVVPSDSNH